MKAEKFRGVDVADLQRQVSDAQEQLFRLRFQMGMGQSEGLKKYRSLKLDRARMLTILREKNAAEPVISATPATTKASAKKSRAATALPQEAGKRLPPRRKLRPQALPADEEGKIVDGNLERSDRVYEPAGHKNEKIGEVISTKMAKTIVVEVTRRVTHPVYKRIINKRRKFYAHDEEARAKIGDLVRIIECRPLSRLKRWQLGTILRQAVQVSVEHPALAASADTRVKKTIKKKKKA